MQIKVFAGNREFYQGRGRFAKNLQPQARCIWQTRGRFKNTYELLNLRALNFSAVNKIYIFQCMGKIFCVEFQRVIPPPPPPPPPGGTLVPRPCILHRYKLFKAYIFQLSTHLLVGWGSWIWELPLFLTFLLCSEWGYWSDN